MCYAITLWITSFTAIAAIFAPIITKHMELKQQKKLAIINNLLTKRAVAYEEFLKSSSDFIYKCQTGEENYFDYFQKFHIASMYADILTREHFQQLTHLIIRFRDCNDFSLKQSLLIEINRSFNMLYLVVELRISDFM